LEKPFIGNANKNKGGRSCRADPLSSLSGQGKQRDYFRSGVVVVFLRRKKGKGVSNTPGKGGKIIEFLDMAAMPRPT
jgi:hypothetical protein